jgi:molybdate transport system permease protein
VAAGNMGEAFNYVIVIVIIAFIAIFIMDYISIRKEKQWK